MDRTLAPKLATAVAALLAARCGAALPEPASPEAEPLDWPAAFVVYGAAGTLVVPVLPSEAATFAAGSWVLDGEVVVRAEQRSSEELAASMGCESLAPAEGLGRCGASSLGQGAAHLVLETYSPEGERLTGPSLAGALEGCGCFEPEPEADRPGSTEPEGLEPEAASPGAGAAGCEPVVRAFGPVSLVGGLLSTLRIEDSSACGGEGARPVVETLALAAGTLPEGRGAEVCVPGLALDDWSALDRPCPRARSRRPGCAPCRSPRPQAFVPFAWSGQLVELGLDLHDAASPVAVVRTRPLSEAECPSPADPCGPADRFVGLEGAEAHWVASDGEAALLHRGGELIVLLPGLDAPLRPGVPFEGEVIGVRYHADATPLVRAMEAP